MNELFTAIPTGFTAFTATNLDDIVILLLFFSQVSATFRRQHIVAGQYLGFSLLVLASLPGFFGGLILPKPWIGLLGLLPIAVGLGRLISPEASADAEESDGDDALGNHAPNIDAIPNWLGSVLSPQSYSVAAVTFANGGDNIGIYVPLFASSSWSNLLTILAVFFSLVGIWCYTAYRLTKVPAIATTLTRYGDRLVPYVLIGLGALILIDSHTLEHRGLATLALVMSCLCLLNFSKEIFMSPKSVS